MSLLSRKFLVILIISFTLLILALLYFLFFQDIFSDLRKERIDTGEITNSISNEARRNESHFDIDRINLTLNNLNNHNLPDERRYEALEKIAFYFSAAYTSSHDPELREFVNNPIKNFAMKSFPNFYEEGSFNIGCADPQCGEKPDDEIKQIQKEINDTGIVSERLDTINKNLEQAIYIPANQTENKMYGFGLVIEQLRFENNPKASAAANLLVDYVREKYSYEFPDEEIKEPDRL